MGSKNSCFPRWRSDAQPAADVVVKIGGSACTIKAQLETLNTEALQETAKHLGSVVHNGCRIAVIHGAGSFGHQYAKEYGVSKGQDVSQALTDNLRKGFAKTRLSVTTLNHHVITALTSGEQALPAIAVNPCPFVMTSAKTLSGGRLPAAAIAGIDGLLSRGFVPVVHGDAVLDDSQSVAILSGDIWMVELCRELHAKFAVFITDVDGVFTKPPSEPGAKLLLEILVDPKSGDIEIAGLELSQAAHDVTGGLREKLRCAATVLASAPSVQAVYIVKAGSTSCAQALRGQNPENGTTLRRR